jgi:hypothetical protein
MLEEILINGQAAKLLVEPAADFAAFGYRYSFRLDKPEIFLNFSCGPLSKVLQSAVEEKANNRSIGGAQAD